MNSHQRRKMERKFDRSEKPSKQLQNIKMQRNGISKSSPRHKPTLP